jgi:hypothetical protein
MKYYIFEWNWIYREINKELWESLQKNEDMYAKKCIYNFWDNITIFSKAEVDAQNIMNNILSNAWFSTLTKFESYRIYSYVAIAIWFIWFCVLWYLNYNSINDFSDFVLKTDTSITEIKKDVSYNKDITLLIWEKAKIDTWSIITEEQKKAIVSQQILSWSNK